MVKKKKSASQPASLAATTKKLHNLVGTQKFVEKRNKTKTSTDHPIAEKVGEACPPPVVQRGGKEGKQSLNEIDLLFGALKKKKQKGPEIEKESKKLKVKDEPIVKGSKDDIFGDGIKKARKRTEEGYFIYSEEEVKFNQGGGGTKLCPFDCQCCF